MRFARERYLRSTKEQARLFPGGYSNRGIDCRRRHHTAIPPSWIRRSRSPNTRFLGTDADLGPHGTAGSSSGCRRHVGRRANGKEPTRLGETTSVVAADDRNRRKYRRQRAQRYAALTAGQIPLSVRLQFLRPRQKNQRFTGKVFVKSMICGSVLDASVPMTITSVFEIK